MNSDAIYAAAFAQTFFYELNLRRKAGQSISEASRAKGLKERCDAVATLAVASWLELVRERPGWVKE